MTVLKMRLAMRQEGIFWNAYFARTETMNGAIHLGSIRMSLIEGSPEVKKAFMDTMQQAMTVAAKQSTGVVLDWPNPPEPAPESERGGHA